MVEGPVPQVHDFKADSERTLRRCQIIVLLLPLLAVAALLLAWLHCPATGCALTPEARALNRLKNRAAPPAPTDFDQTITLASMLAPGDDRARWSEARAGVVEGYVVAVGAGPHECANCYVPGRRDVHIDIALRRDAPSRERLVLEITPRWQDWAQRQGWDWSAQTLARTLVGHRCRFEGWLLFDRSHAGEAENTHPNATGNWRATAWELHPATYLTKLE
jgi:hypothetical protein